MSEAFVKDADSTSFDYIMKTDTLVFDAPNSPILQADHDMPYLLPAQAPIADMTL